jgi:hypothetical protein
MTHRCLRRDRIVFFHDGQKLLKDAIQYKVREWFERGHGFL